MGGSVGGSRPRNGSSSAGAGSKIAIPRDGPDSGYRAYQASENDFNRLTLVTNQLSLSTLP
jgi:hypothetical protein